MMHFLFIYNYIYKIVLHTLIFAHIVWLKTTQDAFMENYGSDVRMADVFGEDSEYDVGRQLAKEFLEKTGLASLPQVGSFIDW